MEAQERFADSRAEGIRSFLDKNFDESDAGMVIGIIDEQGSRVFSAGKMGNGTEREVDGDTIFEIGSVTKVFTSLLLLDAVRRGEMQLDDPVVKYLPEGVTAPTRSGKEITLLNLAAQESGLPFNPDNFSGGELDLNAYTADQLYRYLSGYELTVDPGAGFRYSNTGFALLGHVLERRTGIDYEALVVDRILRPIGMNHTGITLAPELRFRLTTGHYPDGRAAAHFDLKVMAPAGALLSTANDLLKFLSTSLNFDPSPLTPLIEETLVVRHKDVPRYGTTAMPWIDLGVYNPPGSEILSHGGGTDGYRTFLGIERNKRRGVVVLTNQRAVGPAYVGFALLQEMPLSQHNTTAFVQEVMGLGVSLAIDEGSKVLRITSVFPESSAGQAGLIAATVIEKINGISVTGKSIQESLQLMAGPAGTTVQLEIINPETQQTKTVELTKQKFLTSIE